MQAKNPSYATRNEIIFLEINGNNLILYNTDNEATVSKIALKFIGDIFCPSKYINLVIAASVVMSFPEIIPMYVIRPMCTVEKHISQN